MRPSGRGSIGYKRFVACIIPLRRTVYVVCLLVFIVKSESTDSEGNTSVLKKSDGGGYYTPKMLNLTDLMIWMKKITACKK